LSGINLRENGRSSGDVVVEIGLARRPGGGSTIGRSMPLPVNPWKEDHVPFPRAGCVGDASSGAAF
jgi:hypothetical protein